MNAAPHDVRLIDIAWIDVPARLRSVSDGRVLLLADSMAQVGQDQPITVNVPGAMRVPDFPDRVELVAGAHRLAAARSLGWSTIAARLIAVDRRQARLIEIDENLVRSGLSILDRAICLAERKRVWEELHPAPKRGRPKNTCTVQVILGFAAEAAAASGLDESTIYRDLSLVRDLDEGLVPRIQPTQLADRRAELRLLADHAPERQAAILDLIEAGEAGSVPDAVALIEGRAQPAVTPFKRLTGRFERLSKAEKFEVLDHFEDIVLEWLEARRGGME